MSSIVRNRQFYKFCFYGFFKNLKFFVPFFLLFLKSKDISYTEIGFLYGIKEITQYIFEVPSGILADVWGRKRTLIFSFGIYILSFFLFYISQHFLLLCIAMISFALGNAFRSGTHKAMIFDYLAHHGRQGQKTAYYGATRSCSQKGSALSAIAAAVFIFFTQDYASIFLFSTIPFFVDIFLVLSYPDYLNGTAKPISLQAFFSRLKQHFRFLAQELKQWKSIRTYLNISSFTGYYKELKDYLQIILVAWAVQFSGIFPFSENQLSALSIGIGFFILYLLTSIASQKSHRILALFPSKTKALNFLFFIGVSIGLLAGLLFQFQYFTIAVGLFSLIYIIENFRKPIGVSFIGDTFNKETMATNLSLASLADTILAGSIAFLTGFLVDTIGLGYALSSVSLFFLLIFVLFFRFRRQ